MRKITFAVALAFVCLICTAQKTEKNPKAKRALVW